MPDLTQQEIDAKNAADKAAKAAAGQYPKVLADSTDQARDNRSVHNAAEESAARADGFTKVLSAAVIPPKGPASLEFPRMVYHKAHGYRTVRSLQEHKESLGDGWQNDPIAEDGAAFVAQTSVETLAAHVATLELRIANLERNQQGAAPSTPTAPFSKQKG